MTFHANWVLFAIACDRTKDKINSFANLPAGWHYGEGGPIAAGTRDLASRLQSSLLQSGFTQTDAFPGVEGEIQLTAYHGPYFISIMIEPTDEMTLTYQIAGRDEIDPVTTTDRLMIERTLRGIAGGIWNIYDSSTRRTLITNEGASRKLHSNDLPGTEAHLY